MSARQLLRVSLLALIYLSGNAMSPAGKLQRPESVQTVSSAEAEILVVALPEVRQFLSQRGRMPSVTVGDFPGLNSADFFAFSVYDRKAKNRSPLIGHFAVNKYSAEVVAMGPSEPVHDAYLAEVQRIIRETHEITEELRERHSEDVMFKSVQAPK